jgi:hypothetical protein
MDENDVQEWTRMGKIKQEWTRMDKIKQEWTKGLNEHVHDLVLLESLRSSNCR